MAILPRAPRSVRDLLGFHANCVQSDLLLRQWDAASENETVKTQHGEVTVSVIAERELARLRGVRVNVDALVQLTLFPGRTAGDLGRLEPGERRVYDALDRFTPQTTKELAAKTGYKWARGGNRYFEAMVRRLWTLGLSVEHVDGWLRA
jgi:hypothetical protein